MSKFIAFILFAFWSVFTLLGNNLPAIVTSFQSLLQPVSGMELTGCCNIEEKPTQESGCCLLKKESTESHATHDSKGCSDNDNDGHDCEHQGNCNRVCCQILSGIRPAAIFCSPLPAMHTITTYPTLSSHYLPSPFISSDFPPPNIV